MGSSVELQRYSCTCVKSNLGERQSAFFFQSFGEPCYLFCWVVVRQHPMISFQVWRAPLASYRAREEAAGMFRSIYYNKKL